jgi:hypothetical protein
MVKSDPLCRGLMSRDHGTGLWDRGPIPCDFQWKNNLVTKENSPALEILQKHPNFFELCSSP